jgi:hypothetical protein
MLTVYHNVRFGRDAEYGNTMLVTTFQKQPVTILRSDLEAVAVMDDAEFTDVEEALDRAYGLTQNKKGDWWENEGITALRDIGERSTSVGDVIEANGEFWIMAMTGFYQCTVV